MRALATVLALLPVPASAADWTMISETSRLEYVARYEGEPAPGRFHRFDVRVAFDPRRPREGRLHVTVALASVDMQSADINETIVEPPWLDVAGHPRAEFTSETITRTGDGRFVARGTLRLNGVTHELDVPFQWRRHDARATLSGEVTVNRMDFGIGIGEWSSGRTIDLEVVVRYEVELERAT
ncbi:MAG: YceI family protein [Gammaproteobacteria bacterium]|nr:YceI family protein [Gammaproteobacteria bacterium]